MEKTDMQGVEIFLKPFLGLAFHPLNHAKILQQLGFEPFPLSVGKMYFIGRETYFLPNTLEYGMFYDVHCLCCN